MQSFFSLTRPQLDDKCISYLLAVKSLVTPSHSMFGLYFDLFLHCRKILKTSKLWTIMPFAVTTALQTFCLLSMSSPEMVFPLLVCLQASFFRISSYWGRDHQLCCAELRLIHSTTDILLESRLWLELSQLVRCVLTPCQLRRQLNRRWAPIMSFS